MATTTVTAQVTHPVTGAVIGSTLTLEVTSGQLAVMLAERAWNVLTIDGMAVEREPVRW